MGPMTRRDFLKLASAAPLAGALVPANAGEAAPRPARSRVVLIRDAKAVDAAGRVDVEVVQRMLDEAVASLLGEKDARQAWRAIVRPDDTVGIKSNVWSYLPTPREVEQAIARRVTEAGVPGSRLAVDDRGVLDNPVFRRATALVNVRPARTHHWAGLGSLIKNYIMFVPEPSAWHADACADLGGIWRLPHVEGRTRLNVLVMLTPLFHGIGPHHFSKQYLWTYGGLVVSRDPVAADATGLRILQAKRRRHFGEDRPLQPTPHHVFLADTRHGLGASGEDRIELVRLGWQEGALI
jgi:hypothetical protein